MDNPLDKAGRQLRNSLDNDWTAGGVDSMTDSGGSHLAIALSGAVPLYIIEFQAQGGPSPDDYQRASAFGDTLGEHGDKLLFGGGEPGQSAQLFNGLAHSIATLAFLPGGVSIFGQHWDAEPKAQPSWQRRQQRKAAKAAGRKV